MKAQRFTLAMPAWVTVDEIGRVDPSVNDSSTPSARLQIALQKRPLIDCHQAMICWWQFEFESRHDNRGDVFARDLAGIRTCRGNSRLVEFDVVGACKKTPPKIPEGWWAFAANDRIAVGESGRASGLLRQLGQ